MTYLGGSLAPGAVGHHTRLGGTITLGARRREQEARQTHLGGLRAPGTHHRQQVVRHTWGRGRAFLREGARSFHPPFLPALLRRFPSPSPEDLPDDPLKETAHLVTFHTLTRSSEMRLRTPIGLYLYQRAGAVGGARLDL